MQTFGEKRLKLLKIYSMLLEESSENNQFSSEDIIKRLHEEGVKCDRKTLYTDMQLLMKAFPEIDMERRDHNYYYVNNRLFEDAEIKALIDTVVSAYFIPQKDTEVLTKKLASLAGKNKNDFINRNINLNIVKKTENRYLLYWVDTITQAINTKSAIEFTYFDMIPSGSVEYRHNKQVYQAVPLALKFNNGKYYLQSYRPGKGITTFRLDKMNEVNISNEVIEVPDNIFNRDEAYFDMYSGKPCKITLTCEKSLIDQVLEKFDIVHYEVIDNNFYRVTIIAPLVPPFFGWISTYGEKLTIFAPHEAIVDYKVFLQENLDRLKN